MRQNKAWLQDILFQNVSATENVKVTKRIRPQNVSAQNLHLQSVSAQNLHLQNVYAQNLHLPNVSAQNLHLQNVSSQNLHLQNVIAIKGIRHKTYQLQVVSYH